MTNATLDALHATFGFSAFRGVQDQVVGRVLAGQSTLAVMPTGAGKSLTYQLPAVMMQGTCVVVSPLIALMHDQLRSATANGIRAAALTSVDNDHARALHHDCGQLVGQRLARASGHDRERGLAGQHAPDNLVLHPAKGAEPESGVERV